MKLNTANRRTQGGAVLVVAMLLLLVLTLLAVSGMNTASLELVMAGNTQYYQNAFQAAEAGVERQLVSGKFNPAETEGPTTATIYGSDKVKTTITPSLSGKAQPALWGSSWDSFSTYHFEIESVGSSARNAEVTNVQGVAVIAPADSTVAPLSGTTTFE